MVDYLGARLDFGSGTFRFKESFQEKLTSLAAFALTAADPKKPLALDQFRSLTGSCVWVMHLSRVLPCTT